VHAAPRTDLVLLGARGRATMPLARLRVTE
jgi:hypothetical protein